MGIKTEEAYKEIERYLKSNGDEALALAKEVDGYDGSCEWADTWDLEELCHCADAYEIARAIIYGEVNNIGDDVRYNAYGNLESVSEYDLEGEAVAYLSDYLDNAIDYYESNKIVLYDPDLKELVDAYINIRDEEYEEE